MNWVKAVSYTHLDGFDEVITAKNFEVLILDGRTGEVKKRAKTPFSTPEEMCIRDRRYPHP